MTKNQATQRITRLWPHKIPQTRKANGSFTHGHDYAWGLVFLSQGLHGVEKNDGMQVGSCEAVMHASGVHWMVFFFSHACTEPEREFLLFCYLRTSSSLLLQPAHDNGWRHGPERHRLGGLTGGQGWRWRFAGIGARGKRSGGWAGSEGARPPC